MGYVIPLILLLVAISIIVWNLNGPATLRFYRYKANARILGAKTRTRIRFERWLDS